ncbi:MAG TPA: Gfo/Idh/MocA family oxidoreductase [Vicinamibacterales bacterium]
MGDASVPRRDFLATGVGLAAAALAVPARVRGANDRIGIGVVGCGVRGRYLLNEILNVAADRVDVVALCDVWTPARERLAEHLQSRVPGAKPKLMARHQDLLAVPGLDAVVIATPDHTHTTVLIDAVRAGKDAYVEKPLSARLEDAVAALDAVKATDRIVQVGTQRRSSPRFHAAYEYVRSGALGDICKIETAWNRNVASWARPYDMVREQDVDWEQYLGYLPKRPFDPMRYVRWQCFHDYTTGLVGLLGSHMIDVALWFMEDPFPTSAVALGGTLTWRDGREISDTAEYVFEFPKGWLLTFSSRLGSGPESDYQVFYGRKRFLDSRDWTSRPADHRRPPDAQDYVLPAPPARTDGSLTAGDAQPHVRNWIECIQSRRTPNAPIDVGFAHAVACCLGREAERTGRRMRYDAATRTIVEARMDTD